MKRVKVGQDCSKGQDCSLPHKRRTMSDEWACDACTFVNEATNSECACCGKLSNQPGWKCEGCTMENTGGSRVCSVCATPKSVAPSGGLNDQELMAPASSPPAKGAPLVPAIERQGWEMKGSEEKVGGLY
jgi:hypothetical protein